MMVVGVVWCMQVEAQKKIEEMVRMENVNKNWEVAMEEMPEVGRC